jgi:hypothetical protein
MLGSLEHSILTSHLDWGTERTARVRTKGGLIPRAREDKRGYIVLMCA